MKQDQINVDKMVLLLATIYESARLVSAGSLLQRCSLKHGTISHFFFSFFLKKLNFLYKDITFCASVFCVLCIMPKFPNIFRSRLNWNFSPPIMSTDSTHFQSSKKWNQISFLEQELTIQKKQNQETDPYTCVEELEVVSYRYIITCVQMTNKYDNDRLKNGTEFG